MRSSNQFVILSMATTMALSAGCGGAIDDTSKILALRLKIIAGAGQSSDEKASFAEALTFEVSDGDEVMAGISIAFKIIDADDSNMSGNSALALAWDRGSMADDAATDASTESPDDRRTEPLAAHQSLPRCATTTESAHVSDDSGQVHVDVGAAQGPCNQVALVGRADAEGYGEDAYALILIRYIAAP